MRIRPHNKTPEHIPERNNQNDKCSDSCDCKDSSSVNNNNNNFDCCYYKTGYSKIVECMYFTLFC